MFCLFLLMIVELITQLYDTYTKTLLIKYIYFHSPRSYFKMPGVEQICVILHSDYSVLQQNGQCKVADEYFSINQICAICQLIAMRQRGIWGYGDKTFPINIIDIAALYQPGFCFVFSECFCNVEYNNATCYGLYVVGMI